MTRRTALESCTNKTIFQVAFSNYRLTNLFSYKASDHLSKDIYAVFKIIKYGYLLIYISGIIKYKIKCVIRFWGSEVNIKTARCNFRAAGPMGVQGSMPLPRELRLAEYQNIDKVFFDLWGAIVVK